MLIRRERELDTLKENGSNKLKNRDKNSWREEEKGRERGMQKKY